MVIDYVSKSWDDPPSWTLRVSKLMPSSTWGHSVDGWDPSNQLRFVVYPCLSNYSEGFIHPRWWSPHFFHQQSHSLHDKNPHFMHDFSGEKLSIYHRPPPKMCDFMIPLQVEFLQILRARRLHWWSWQPPFILNQAGDIKPLISGGRGMLGQG